MTRGQLPQRAGSLGLTAVGLPPRYPPFLHYYEKLSPVNGKWRPDFIERFKVSALSAVLPLTHDRSESINADTLKLQFLQLGRSGGRPQRTVYRSRLPVNCETHCVSGDRTHNLPIVSLTRYQLCYRDHHITHGKLCLLDVNKPFCIIV